MISQTEKHFVGLDWLRGFAAFFIVGCHLGLPERTAGGVALTFFCDSFVGVFAAIGGFLLYKSITACPSNDIKRILNKRIRRLFPIYVIWTILWLVVRWGAEPFLGGGSFSQESSEGLRFWGRVVFGGGARITLWFLINLLYAQIAICFFSRIASRLLNNIWFTTIFALGFLWWAVVDKGYLGYYTARLFSFVLLGWCVALCWERLPNSVRGWGIASLGCLVAHYFISGYIPRFICDFVCVVPLLMCAVSFCSSRYALVGRFLASTSLGVYIWHPLLVLIIQRIIVKTFQAPYTVGIILLAWVGTYLLALGITFFVEKTPLRCLQR